MLLWAPVSPWRYTASKTRRSRRSTNGPSCWYGPTAMWHVTGTPGDRAVFVGEAMGIWIWAVAWPERAGMMLYDELVLTDLRDAGAEVELVPCGALSPRLLEP